MDRFFRRAITLLEWWAVLLLIMMVAVVLLGVFFRYILNASLAWYDEFASYLLVWLTFYGAVDTQHTLPYGSPDEVRAQVRHYVELCRNGGYILAGSQELIEDIPADNILAMYELNLR